MKEQGQAPGRTASKFDPQAARERCECGDKIGFYDLKRQLAEAQGKLYAVQRAAQGLLDALGRPRVASRLRTGRAEVMLHIGNLYAAPLRGTKEGDE